MAKKSTAKPAPRTAAKTKPADKTKPKTKRAAGNRAAAAIRSRNKSADEREIGPIPPVRDPERRAECERNLALALKTYFPDLFPLPWSSQHHEVIATMDTVLRGGGLFALGMPRGSGKTSIAIACSTLAIVYGWRRYLAIIGAIQNAASGMLEALKSELEENPVLFADFPEVCFPIHALEYTPQRARGQTSQGEHTAMKWDGRKRIILPSVAGSKASGAIVQAVGLTGNIRGMFHRTKDGPTIRPDVYIGDDLQTDASAAKVEQIERRENILNGAVNGLAGPGKRIAGVVTITVQRKGDLADRLLDNKANPHMQGRRFRLVERWPDATELWAQYAEKRDADLARGHVLLPTATKFYKTNRVAMDRGAIVPWEARHEPQELSALQSAYNLKLKHPLTFDAEYQNDPAASVSAEGVIAAPDSDAIVRRVNGFKRGEIPQEATHLVAGIDVQQDALFWMVAAVNEALTGWVVDYGAWPEQPAAYWTLRQISATIRQRTGIASLEASLFAALDKLTESLFSRDWIRDDGAAMKIDTAIVDANWGLSTSTVYSFCRQFAGGTLIPFHGRGITSKQQPIAARKRKAGERAGESWYMPKTRGTKTPRHVIADTNIIKTIIADRWRLPIGSAGAWTFWNAPAAGHRMFADHLAAEYPIETSGRGRTLLEWSLRPGRDNHYLDCSVMATTAAIMLGCAPLGTSAGSAPRLKAAPRSLADLRAEAAKRRRQG